MSGVPVTCPLCEATCGLLVSTREDGTIGVRGDRDDVFSRGYLCPKGASIGELHADPDRLRRPLLKRGGRHVEVDWEEAFAEIERRLPPLLDTHGRDAVAVYFGNPTAHNLSGALYLRPLLKALGTRNVFSAGTVDQAPKTFVCGYLYGDAATIAVPDLDRTNYLLVLGGNPLVSNGSLMTAPDMRGRLRAITARGKVVVVDPRRTRTAEAASEHVPIRPGSDALLLLAMVHTLFAEDLVDLGLAAPYVDGLEQVRAIAAEVGPEDAAPHTGIDAGTIRRLARELAAADRAVVYGRMGTTAQPFGTLASWLIDVLNILTGNLDTPGGAMFPLAAAGQANTRPGPRRPFRHGRWHGRASGRPEVMGELPAATLAEEIAAPGEDRVRALVTLSGNPVLSVPGATRLEAALEELELMVSIDVYLNETTRHADVVLPGPSPLERSHYDLLLYQYSVRNIARYSPAVHDTDVPPEWHTMLRLAAIAGGLGAGAAVTDLDDALAQSMAELNAATPEPGLCGPERLLDILLKAGPYDLTFADVAAAPHGLDLGPLQPRLPGVLATGRIDLVPEPVLADLDRLRTFAARQPGAELLLIGRRHLRSNNSWMHNVATLNRAGNDCTLHLHPDDAARLGLADGSDALVCSADGEVVAPVEVTDTIAAGVVCLPHGWGHQVGAPGRVAAARPGVNANMLGDLALLDGPTGTAAVNALPVTVRPATVQPATGT
ncbi:molybdopterin-dependent oxidoreductase [Nocardioides sp. zg-536]|uniref:Molybdopterin-dependent oxidoreductase n=1 Tax=Nocardioides faecalis TaxID=2803858 RepID=A0A938Y925_9ACTN|nr:molybdopterin-dependent oxidoreductase [Nocardioides faecalis]MBM9459711.1 molybdopterin-dependent oxidoreductase [Nocardioides faecalis]QVI58230.1 molybdopterin-dependent oxidoreductase [Nocardioides faecalis]